MAAVMLGLRPGCVGCGRIQSGREDGAAWERGAIVSRVHWVRLELVAEVKFLTWTDDNLLRQVVYEGLHEDKPAAEVGRPMPYPKAGAAAKR